METTMPPRILLITSPSLRDAYDFALLFKTHTPACFTGGINDAIDTLYFPLLSSNLVPDLSEWELFTRLRPILLDLLGAQLFADHTGAALDGPYGVREPTVFWDTDQPEFLSLIDNLDVDAQHLRLNPTPSTIDYSPPGRESLYFLGTPAQAHSLYLSSLSSPDVGAA